VSGNTGDFSSKSADKPDSFIRKSIEDRLSRNDRAAYLQYRGRHDQSIDTIDCIKRKRQPSIESEELNIKDDIMLRDVELSIPGKPKVEDA
jgi:hypothetical protein